MVCCPTFNPKPTFKKLSASAKVMSSVSPFQAFLITWAAAGALYKAVEAATTWPVLSIVFLTVLELTAKLSKFLFLLAFVMNWVTTSVASFNLASVVPSFWSLESVIVESFILSLFLIIANASLTFSKSLVPSANSVIFEISKILSTALAPLTTPRKPPIPIKEAPIKPRFIPRFAKSLPWTPSLKSLIASNTVEAPAPATPTHEGARDSALAPKVNLSKVVDPIIVSEYAVRCGLTATSLKSLYFPSLCFCMYASTFKPPFSSFNIPPFLRLVFKKPCVGYFCISLSWVTFNSS